MKDNITSIGNIYENFIKPLLKQDGGIDAECLTNFSLNLLSIGSRNKELPLVSNILNNLRDEFCIENNKLNQEICGINFSNPIGLAAGFDKNGIAANIWQEFGFGFSEIGTVTKYGQPGNPKPRLFRISNEQAALNRMGFNNDGADSLLKNFKKQKIRKRSERMKQCLGINFGKSKITPLKDSTSDYISSIKLLIPFCDYAAINVSSPNTEGLRKLQDPKLLRELLQEVKKTPSCPPLFVKIAPDLDLKEIEEICQLINDEKIDGIIATNTSLDRLGLDEIVIKKSGLKLSQESGGISGKPLRLRSNEIVKHIHKIDKNIILIGVGGIDSPESAWERISSGASLIQLYTGWIYQGPRLVPDILNGIIKQLDIYKISNIKEVIGSGLSWQD